jgi:multisubunit Na+/H+ antiporter MnhB subunit
MTKTDPLRLVILSLSLLAITALGIVLAWALWSLPPEAAGLSLIVNENMPESGVNAEVTAILLNFRSYDTLLEIVVLLVALLGVWYQGSVHRPDDDTSPGPVLEALVQFLIPVIIVVSGYILWLGSHAAGGAFQAGALLAGAGVLMLVVSAEKLALRDNIRMRILLVAGPGVFTLVAGGLMMAGNLMLQYPRDYAGSLILLIEAASTLTIGITLTLLFAGSRPRQGGRN